MNKKTGAEESKAKHMDEKLNSEDSRAKQNKAKQSI